MKLRFHLVSLAHTETTADYVACAYTQKVVKFCRMMMPRGHECFLYAGERNEAPCTEHIQVITRQEQEEWVGKHDPAKLLNPFADDNVYWQQMNARAVREIRARAKPRDFLCLIAGLRQKPIADALPDLMAVEYGVGYEGIFAKYRAFESHAWRHFIHGLNREGDGRDFDAVIPNYFDPDEFPFSAEKDDYCLFIGRLIRRKGPQIAVEATRHAGVRLLLAGGGVRSQEPGKIVGEDVVLSGSHIEHVGPVDARRRGELMSRARAVFVPTIYLEPFGGVAVEAMLASTPVITSDYGVFPETVIQGVTGFRCHTPSEYAHAVDAVCGLDPYKIRQHAMQYSLEAVAPRYEEWFGRLLGQPPVFTGSHLGGYIKTTPLHPHGDDWTYYPKLWAWLLDEFKPRTVLDIGCGEGHALAWFAEHVPVALGIDGAAEVRDAGVVDPGRIIVHDFTTGPATHCHFDLGWCCEFVEHVEERFAENFLKTFNRCRVLAMTHAEPGQLGYHHVNCQPSGYWIELLEKRGFRLLKKLTEKSRQIGHAHWTRSGMIFEQIEAGSRSPLPSPP